MPSGSWTSIQLHDNLITSGWYFTISSKASSILFVYSNKLSLRNFECSIEYILYTFCNWSYV